MNPIVVTGIGVAAPNGLTPEDFWAATRAGRSGIGELTDATTGTGDENGEPRPVGQIKDFDDERHVPSRLLPQTDRVTRLALYAAQQALVDAGLDQGQVGDYDVGVTLSNASGGFEFTHREFRKLWSQGPGFVSVYESFAWFYACNTGQISIRHGLRGPSSALVAEQAGGLDAIGYARRGVRKGTRVMVTGGVDSAFDPWGWLSHQATGQISRAGRDAGAGAERAYLPFDVAATGYLPGEGGAVLVLESARSADERQAPNRYGSVLGYAATFDPRPGSGRPPGLRRAAELALADAGLGPGEIDVVFADGAGTAAQDRAEAHAITGLFGPHAVPVCVPKALTGRLYAGGGALDAVAALLSIRDGVLPPVPSGTRVPDGYGIDLVVGTPRRQPVGHALVLARGRGGFNSALVLGPAATAAPTTPSPHDLITAQT